MDNDGSPRSYPNPFLSDGGTPTREPPNGHDPHPPCDLVFKSSGQSSGGDSSTSFAKFRSGVAMTMICTKVCREYEYSKQYRDGGSKGPFFSSPESPLLIASNVFSCDSTDAPYQPATVVPLSEIVRHLVATVRVEVAHSGKKPKKTITTKDRAHVVHDTPSGSNKRKRDAVAGGGETVVMKKTVYRQYSKMGFSAHPLLQPLFPIMVSHGDVMFSIPLLSLVICIADKMCAFTGVCSQPIAVDRYTAETLDPFVSYTFPSFATSKSLDYDDDDADKPNPLTHPDENYYGPVVNHVRDVICNGDPIAYTAIEMWLAEMLFDPTEKYAACPIISGPQGVGKNCFFDFVLNYVMGVAVTASVSGLDRVTGHFNKILVNKILIMINEENLNKPDRTTEVLRTMCTEVLQCIEGKYRDIEENVEMWARFIILTNKDDPYKMISMSERRFFVIRTTPRIPSATYFNDLYLRIRDRTNAPITALHYVGYLSGIRRGNGPQHFMHPNEYRPEKVLRRPIRTEYTKCKVGGKMPPLHFFLYAFVVRKLSMKTLLPTDSDLYSLPKHQPLVDLKRVERRYFINCLNLYKQYGTGDCEPSSTAIAWGGGLSTHIMEKTTQLNHSLVDFIGNNNSPAYDNLGSNQGRNDSKRVLHGESQGRFGGEVTMFYNLSGTDASLREHYSDCYDYFATMFDEVFSPELNPLDTGVIIL